MGPMGSHSNAALSTRIRDIFDNGDFFHRFRKNTRPHVAYSNRFRPSTRKRLDNENTTASLKGHALYQE